jgi:hypothetical protein
MSDRILTPAHAVVAMLAVPIAQAQWNGKESSRYLGFLRNYSSRRALKTPSCKTILRSR